MIAATDAIPRSSSIRRRRSWIFSSSSSRIIFIIAAASSAVLLWAAPVTEADDSGIIAASIINATAPQQRLQPNDNDPNEIELMSVVLQQHQTNYEEMLGLLASLGLRNSCVHAVRKDLPDIPLCSSSNRIINNARKLEEDLSESEQEEQEEETMAEEEAMVEEKESEWHFSWSDIILAILCLAVSSIAAGLTVGLVSLDPLVLLIKARAGDSKEASQAQKLLPLVKQRHLLLVTLMLLNTATSEALPVVLHDMMPELFVVILSTLLMLFFGEILPSAVFIGSNQLAIAASLAGLVHVIMWLVYPVSYPIAKLLDYLVPSEGDAVATNYTRNELAAMIRLQYETRLAERELKQSKGGGGGGVVHNNNDGNNGSSFRTSSHHNTNSASNLDDRTAAAAVLMRRTNSLDLNEVMIAEGALALRSRSASDLVIHMKKVFSISYDAELTDAMIVHIFASGYSRVPVYRGNDKKQVCGILMTRQLILVKASDQKKVSDLPLHSPRCISPHMDLLELVNLFQTGGGCTGRTRRSAGHMTIVCQKPDIANDVLQADGDLPIPRAAGLMGIITMEDVLEALLQKQIYDEMDASGRVSSMRSGNVNDDDDDDTASVVSSCDSSRTSENNGAAKALAASRDHQQATRPFSSGRIPQPAPAAPTNTADDVADATSYKQFV